MLAGSLPEALRNMAHHWHDGFAIKKHRVVVSEVVERAVLHPLHHLCRTRKPPRGTVKGVRVGNQPLRLAVRDSRGVLFGVLSV